LDIDSCTKNKYNHEVLTYYEFSGILCVSSLSLIHRVGFVLLNFLTLITSEFYYLIIWNTIS
jgi:hypothetical protein